MKTSINKILENSFIDGPGNRMVVFFQGCNMKCLYCHNPETQNICTSCSLCVEKCPSGSLIFEDNRVRYKKDLCLNCDKCIKICNNFSSPKYEEIEVLELFNKIIDNKVFIDGITLSGGECLLHLEYIKSLFTLIKETTNLTTFVDTNGNVEVKKIKSIINETDGFMVDLKAFNKETHLKLTGVSNDLVFNSLEYISKTKKLFEVRTVIVEGYTDSENEIKSIANYIKKLNNYTILKLISFRNYGVKGILENSKSLQMDKYNVLSEIAVQILGKERILTVK